jgi:hypothetical protein
MTVLTVAADAGAVAPGAIPATIASLPMTLSLTTEPDADLRAIDGSPGWSDRVVAAIMSGTRGVVVVHPTAATAAELGALVEHDVPIVLDTRWRHTPVADRLLEGLGAIDGGVSLLEAHAITAGTVGIDDAMRDLLLLAQAAAGPVRHVVTVQRTPARLIVHARVGETDLHAVVDVTRVAAGSAWLRALGATGGVEAFVPDAATARAARLTLTDPSGHTLEPTLYESAHRVAWRRLAQAVRGGVAVDDLPEFARVTEALTTSG